MGSFLGFEVSNADRSKKKLRIYVWSCTRIIMLFGPKSSFHPKVTN